MQTHDEAGQFVTADVAEPMQRSRWPTRWMAALLATLALLGVWLLARNHPYVDTDAMYYRAMANGETVMKPFAFRVLDPAAVHMFARATGRSTVEGFLVVGLLSEWVLLYGVLCPVLERRQDTWLVVVLLLLPFWLRNFTNYFLPDLLHAALCIVYLSLLRRQWWVWAAAIMPLMFLTRESTVLLAVIAVPVLWRLAGKRPALWQLAGAVVGMAVSKFAARHALGNQHNINDTLYLIGKIPWNLSRNVFGITLWTNTLHPVAPIRIWDVPHWMPMGAIHQIGYCSFDWTYQLSTLAQLLTSFGLGSCVAACLIWRTSLRKLLPREEAYLCIAAIYGAATFLMAPVLGAAQTRLFDYGWPLFLVYLPAMIPRIWRSWPIWTILALVGLHLIVAWLDLIGGALFHLDLVRESAVLAGCNLVAAWLLFNTAPGTQRLPSLK